MPTLSVALAVMTMVALGLWQLTVRLPEKEAQLARLAANPARPAIAFPTAPDDRLLFRRAVADCRPPVTLSRAGAGNAGFRVIAACTNGPLIQLGTTRDPMGTTGWPGGPVSGWIGHAPDARPLIAKLFDHTPGALILVADTPAPRLNPNGRPDVDNIPNNHFAYAIQWFLFAGIATIVYLLALRRRSHA